jgi:hypothetical protein
MVLPQGNCPEVALISIWSEKLQPFRVFRFINSPTWKNHDKEQLPQRSFVRIGEASEPEWDRSCPEFLGFECANTYVVKLVIKSAAISATRVPELEFRSQALSREQILT